MDTKVPFMRDLAKRRETSLSPELRDLFVRQLTHELMNFSLYNSFSVYYSCKGLEKLGQYYKGRANEELAHQDWILKYLTECDATFDYPGIPVNAQQKITDDVMPFEATVDREIETTTLILEIADTAFKQGDWLTLSFLMGNLNEARLLPEQIEEESLSRTALDIMRTDDHILKKEDQVYDLYFGNKK